MSDRSLAALRKALAAPASSPVEPATVWYHGKPSYSADRVNQVHVNLTDHYILQSFLKAGVAMDSAPLRKASGVTNVPRAMAELAGRHGTRFKGAIRLPKGVKGAGGYYVRVRPL